MPRTALPSGSPVTQLALPLALAMKLALNIGRLRNLQQLVVSVAALPAPFPGGLLRALAGCARLQQLVWVVPQGSSSAAPRGAGSWAGVPRELQAAFAGLQSARPGLQVTVEMGH